MSSPRACSASEFQTCDAANEDTLLFPCTLPDDCKVTGSSVHKVKLLIITKYPFLTLLLESAVSGRETMPSDKPGQA